MKSKFEKELRKSAYDAVPYNFEEIKQKTADYEPAAIPEKPRYSVLTAFTAVAAVFAVIAVAALGVRLIRSGGLNTAKEQTELGTVISGESVTDPFTQSESFEEYDFDSLDTEPGKTTAFPQSVTPAPGGEETTRRISSGSSDGNATQTVLETVKPAGRETTTAPLTINQSAKSTTVAVTEETAASMHYTYYINSGKYRNYCPGKVIEKDKVGEKIGSVTVTGYWEGFGAVSENKTHKETLSADVYKIKGVSDDVAVCLKFNDKGDAITTNHYYVVINPDADYSPVRDYVIGAGSAKAGTDNNVMTTSKPYSTRIVEKPEDNEYVTGVTVTSKAHTIPE